jgi:hypothetical protein
MIIRRLSVLSRDPDIVRVRGCLTIAFERVPKRAYRMASSRVPPDPRCGSGVTRNDR